MISQSKQPLSSPKDAASKRERREYASYFIDVDWYRKNRRSLYAVLRSRIRLIGGETLARKLQKTDDQSILGALGQQTVDHSEFIPPDLPLMEAVFRVFLLAGNAPLTPIDVRERLMIWWKDIGPYKDVDPQVLERLMDRDRFYGFRRVP